MMTERGMSRRGRLVAPVLTAVVLSLALPACNDEAAEPTTEQVSAKGPAIVLKQVEVPQWTSVSAEVATVDQAQATARIPGILTSLSVSEGDYVKKGQAIGRIVDSQLGYQSAALGAQAVQAEQELARVRYLYDNGVYAKARLQQAQAAAAAARAQQQAVQAVAGQGVVLAPATGRVLMADIPAGSAVAPGMPIATITSGPVVLRMDLPESLASSLRPGSTVRVTGEGEEVLTGSISRVYPSVVAGQVRADATVSGIDTGLIGRRLSAEVESGTKSALLVPVNYIVTRFGVDYVTVRTASDTAALVPVQASPSSEAGKVEILSGVSAGDVLVLPAKAS